MHVQAGGNSSKQADRRIELDLAKEDPGAETDKEQGQRRVNLQEQDRRENRQQDGGEAGGGAGAFGTNPPEVAPRSKKAARQAVAFRHHGPEGAVIGEENLMRLETPVKQNRQGRSQHPRKQKQVIGWAAVLLPGNGCAHISFERDTSW